MNVEKLRRFSEELGSVIPLHGKKPIEKDWPQWGDKKRPFDEREFAGRNAGVVLGPDLVVIDVDYPDRLELFLSNNPSCKIPETFTVRTGSGKHHYYLRITNGKHYKRVVKNSQYGFELRPHRDLMVLPGSTHPETGKKYVLEKDVPIASAPQWVIALLEDKNKKFNTPKLSSGQDAYLKKLSVSGEIKSLVRTSPPTGERSEAIWKVLCSLREAGYDPAAMEYLLRHFPLGEKAREKGEEWMSAEIQRAMEKTSTRTSGNIFSEHDAKARFTSIMTKKFSDSAWLCEGLIPAGEYGFLVAPGSTGKGLFCLKLAYSIATGSSLSPSMDVRKTGRVLYLSYEDSSRTIQSRLNSITPSKALLERSRENRETKMRTLFQKAANGKWYVKGDKKLKAFYECRNQPLEKHDPEVATLNENLRLHGAELSCGPLLTRAHDGFKPSKAFGDLLAYAQSLENLQLIVIDTFAQAAGETEAGNAEAATFNTCMQKLVATTGATVLVTAHTTKEATRHRNYSQALKAHSQRGPSALYSAARFQLTMLPMQSGKRYLSKDDNSHTEYVAMQVTKCNHADHIKSEIILRKHSERGKEAFQIVERDNATPEPTEELEAWIVSQVSAEGLITRRDMLRRYGAKKKNPFGIGGKAFERCVDRCMESGRITVNSHGRGGYTLSPNDK